MIVCVMLCALFLLLPTGPFSRFFNDPSIQEILHVRGHNLPGLNFRPENPHAAGTDDDYYSPPGWEVCNNEIVRNLHRGGN